MKDEEPTGEEQVANSPRERRLELAVTVLLAAAALLSAWCAYQSARYSSRENVGHAAATRLHVAATRADNQAGRLEQIDTIAFFEWVDATAAGDAARATFLRDRFRDEMQPAFAAWVDMDPLTNPDAPGTPFELPEYRVAKADEATAFELTAAVAARTGDEAGSTADQYLLAVVLYAVALFQLGIQSRIGVFELRLALTTLAGAITVGTTIWVITVALRGR